MKTDITQEKKQLLIMCLQNMFKNSKKNDSLSISKGYVAAWEFCPPLVLTSDSKQKRISTTSPYKSIIIIGRKLKSKTKIPNPTRKSKKKLKRNEY